MWGVYLPVIAILSGVLCGVSLGGAVYAQVMQSAQYQIQSDSINVGGGYATSTSYVSESTVGEVASGESASASFALGAGYQQMQEVYLALTGGAHVEMAPAIAGVSGGMAHGSTTVKVTTDSASGYTLTIQSSHSPSMRKDGDFIADYVPEGGVPDFSFDTTAIESHFGYTPDGVDVVQRFKDDGVDTCNVDTANTAFACWDGLRTAAEEIAASTDANHPAGATTTIHFRVGVGGSVIQAPGVYTATTTITAMPL